MQNKGQPATECVKRWEGRRDRNASQLNSGAVQGERCKLLWQTCLFHLLASSWPPQLSQLCRHFVCWSSFSSAAVPDKEHLPPPTPGAPARWPSPVPSLPGAKVLITSAPLLPVRVGEELNFAAHSRRSLFSRKVKEISIGWAGGWSADKAPAVPPSPSQWASPPAGKQTVFVPEGNLPSFRLSSREGQRGGQVPHLPEMGMCEMWLTREGAWQRGLELLQSGSVFPWFRGRRESKEKH